MLSISTRTEILLFDKELKNCYRKVENFVGKGKNASKKHFSFSQSIFQRPVLQGRIVR